MPDFEQWSPTVVAGVAPNAAGAPGTIALSNSRFAMIWSDATHVGTDKSGSGIFIQFYDAFGAASGSPLQVNSTSPGDQIYAGGCGLVDGGAVVFWEDVSTGAIRAQRFSSAGQKAGAELLIDAAGGHGTLDVEGLPGGGFVVAWTDTDGQGMGVRAQVYSATGGKVGIERVVNTQTAGDQGHPTIAVLPSGEFVVAWEGDGLWAQHFSANGAAIGNELLLAPLSPPRPSSGSSESYLFGQIVGLPDGNFVAICNDRQVYDLFDDGQFKSNGIIYSQVFSPAGVAIGNSAELKQYAFTVAQDSAGNQFDVTDIFLDMTGGLYISYDHLRALPFEDNLATVSHYSIAGDLLSELVAARDHYNPSFLPAFALLSDGRVVGAWEEFADGTLSDTRKVVILDDRGASFAGGVADDFIVGATQGAYVNNVINGGSGNDTIHGMNGNDQIFGSGGADLLFGGNGADALDGGLGNDVLTGGDGKDLLTGSGGLDRMDFNSLSASRVTFASRDVVNTFAHGDKIDLSDIDANSLIGGNQAFNFVTAFTGVAGQLQWDLTNISPTGVKGYLVQGDVNGDAAADFSLQIYTSPTNNLPGGSAGWNLAAWDFIL